MAVELTSARLKKKLLCLAVLGLCCCTGCSVVVVCRLLIAVASLVAEHRLQGTQTQ